jgi:hypothetical protein
MFEFLLLLLLARVSRAIIVFLVHSAAKKEKIT